MPIACLPRVCGWCWFRKKGTARSFTFIKRKRWINTAGSNSEALRREITKSSVGIESKAWEDPEFLKPFEMKGERVSLQEGVEKIINVTASQTKAPETRP